MRTPAVAEFRPGRAPSPARHAAAAGTAAGAVIGLPRYLQARRASSQCGDPCEQEADAVAQQVMRAAPPAPQPTGAPAATEASTAPSPLGAGQALDRSTRAFFEPRFGADFSRVRIHAGQAAAQSARAARAVAYTAGHDLVFDSGRFAPHSQAGRELLAHELTHVVQQSGGNDGPRPAGTGPQIRPAASPAGAVMRQEANPAEYEWVTFNPDGSWDELAILARISQRESTETRTYKHLPGAGTESDEVRCAANASLAAAIAAGPRAVVQLCVNLYKRVMQYRDRGKGGASAETPSEDLSNRACNQIFRILRDIEHGMRYGSHEGGACTLTFADFDRLANWLYTFSFNPEDETRRLGKAGQGDLQGGQARFRSDDEIVDTTKMAGYDKGDGRYPVKDEADLDAKLATLKAGESLIGLWGPHTFTFFRSQQDGLIYLYNSWPRHGSPLGNVFAKGSERYEHWVQDGLTREHQRMILLLGHYVDPRDMWHDIDFNVGGVHLSR